jgi:folate-binding protein YgfZ
MVFEGPYRTVRDSIGWWHREDLGFLAITGPDRFTWLQGMVSNDTRLLATGQAERLPVCFLDATGHLLSDGVLITVAGTHPLAAAMGATGQDLLLAELPKTTVARILAHLDRLLIMEDVELADVSAKVRAITLQGPHAATFLERAIWTSRTKSGATFWTAIEFACRTVQADHTGSGGLDLYLGIDSRLVVEDALNSLAAWEIDSDTIETLRVEAGIPRYGIDMDETVLAPEANLTGYISLTKGCYVGQEIVARIDARGHTNRALTGLILDTPDGSDLPTSGTKLHFLSDTEPPRETGRLTSIVASSPAAGDRAIALGYVRHEHREPGTRLVIGENGQSTATVAELPFYTRPSA